MCVCEKTLLDSRVDVCVKEKVSALLDSSVCACVCACVKKPAGQQGLCVCAKKPAGQQNVCVCV